MVRTSTRTRGFGRFKARLPLLIDLIHRAGNRGVEDTLEDMKDSAQKHLSQKDARATNMLRESLRVNSGAYPQWRGRRTTHHRFRAGGKLASWAAYVEFGTGMKNRQSGRFNFPSPSMSNALVSGILRWMNVKPVAPKMETQLGSATAIAHSIARNGTPPQPYMRPALAQHKYMLPFNVRKEVRKDVQKFARTTGRRRP